MSALYILNHSFYASPIFGETYFTCKNCNIVIYYIINNDNKIYYYSKLYSKNKVDLVDLRLSLTCEEHQIKNLLE